MVWKEGRVKCEVMGQSLSKDKKLLLKEYFFGPSRLTIMAIYERKNRLWLVSEEGRLTTVASNIHPHLLLPQITNYSAYFEPLSEERALDLLISRGVDVVVERNYPFLKYLNHRISLLNPEDLSNLVDPSFSPLFSQLLDMAHNYDLVEYASQHAPTIKVERTFNFDNADFFLTLSLSSCDVILGVGKKRELKWIEIRGDDQNVDLDDFVKGRLFKDKVRNKACDISILPYEGERRLWLERFFKLAVEEALLVRDKKNGKTVLITLGDGHFYVKCLKELGDRTSAYYCDPFYSSLYKAQLESPIFNLIAAAPFSAVERALEAFRKEGIFIKGLEKLSVPVCY